MKANINRKHVKVMDLLLQLHETIQRDNLSINDIHDAITAAIKTNVCMLASSTAIVAEAAMRVARKRADTPEGFERRLLDALGK